MPDTHTDVLPEMRALFKLVDANDLHVASDLIDSLDQGTTRQLVFSLVEAVQECVTGSISVFESVLNVLASAGVANSLDVDAARRQFRTSLGTDFGGTHGA